MNTKYQNYKNILLCRGTIDPATIKHAELSIELSDKIEYWYNEWRVSARGSYSDDAEKKIKDYATQYFNHTKEYYIRG